MEAVKETAAPRTTPPRRTARLEEAVFLQLMRTTDMLSRALVQLLKSRGLSPVQYNVLRILRGAPGGLSCGEIAGRLITRDPDITRLLDRLEQRSLVSRRRETRDRRTVLTRITPAALELLAGLDGPVHDLHRKQLSHMGRERLESLHQLLRSARNEPA